MPTNAIDADSIGANIDLADVAIPEDIGERLRAFYDSDEPPATAAEWLAHTEAAIVRRHDRKPTIEDLCTTEDGDHAFESADGDYRQEYVCVLDPIAYPYLTDRAGTITSTTPVRNTTVTVGIDASGVERSHDEALVSLGVSNHVDQVDEITFQAVYRQVCGYIQTFEDEEEYEAWASTVDAATTPLSMETGISVAGAMTKTLFE